MLYLRQQSYYAAIKSGSLAGPDLRDAHDYLRYFEDVVGKIDKIPSWPHLAKVSSAFGFSITPALIAPLINLGSLAVKLIPGHP